MAFTANNLSERTTRIPVELNGSKFWVEVEVARTGRENVSAMPSGTKSFQPVVDSMQAIASAVNDSLERIKPTKASVKYGLKIGIEQGSLMAAIVKGKGDANLEITLEWER